ncbi:zinc finger AN1 domain-containing stress-associated protein 12 [Silene latifolia]|uniref:zinc finger AN1 domain-containing stress-associated protein 12 n=1 Tax=Silene latifolia TaxID=37657 RepID=UPI003D770F50
MSRFLDAVEFYSNVNKKKKEDVGGGTEAFPDLGAHCEQPDCRQLDFLPFDCDRCHKTFCLDHRTYKSHECTRPNERDRKVFVCNICSTSIETTGCFGAKEKAIIDKHLNSKDCDPLKKNKPRCSAHRCKSTLTFSNNVVCRFCNVKFCLNHRFPADHACKRGTSSSNSKNLVERIAKGSRAVKAY